MGIKGFVKWITRFAPSGINMVNFDDIKNKKLGIDASLMIYRAELAMKGSGYEMRNDKGQITSHLYVMFFSTINLIKNNILPIYVFDSKPNELKNYIIKKRNIRKDIAQLFINKLNKKLKIKMKDEIEHKIKIKKIKDKINKLEVQTFNISNEMENDLMKMFDFMGIPYIRATSEADSLLAYMNIKGYIDGVISEDSDISIFGAYNLYKNVYPGMKTKIKKKIFNISYEKILNELKWTRTQLASLAVLLGSDYAPTINSVGMVKATELINSYTLDKIADIYKVDEKDKKQMMSALDLFLNDQQNQSKEIESELDNLKFGPFHPNKLYEFLVDQNQLNKDRVMKQINFLKNSINKMKELYEKIE